MSKISLRDIATTPDATRPDFLNQTAASLRRAMKFARQDLGMLDITLTDLLLLSEKLEFEEREADLTEEAGCIADIASELPGPAADASGFRKGDFYIGMPQLFVGTCKNPNCAVHGEFDEARVRAFLLRIVRSTPVSKNEANVYARILKLLENETTSIIPATGGYLLRPAAQKPSEPPTNLN